MPALVTLPPNHGLSIKEKLPLVCTGPLNSVLLVKTMLDVVLVPWLSVSSAKRAKELLPTVKRISPLTLTLRRALPSAALMTMAYGRLYSWVLSTDPER